MKLIRDDDKKIIKVKVAVKDASFLGYSNISDDLKTKGMNGLLNLLTGSKFNFRIK